MDIWAFWIMPKGLWLIHGVSSINKMGLHFGQHSLVEVGAEGGQTKHETWDNDYESVKLSLFELIFLCHKPQLGMKVGGLNLEDCRPRNSTWEGKKQTGKSRKKPKLGSLGKLQACKFRGNIHQKFSEIICLIRNFLACMVRPEPLRSHIESPFPRFGFNIQRVRQKVSTNAQLCHWGDNHILSRPT